MIRYCIAVQTKSVAEKRAGVYGQGGLGSDVRLDKNRGARDELYGEEVKVRLAETYQDYTDVRLRAYRNSKWRENFKSNQ